MTRESSAPPAGKEIPGNVRPLLISLGRGLGTVSVYGTGHPLVDRIVEQVLEELPAALQNRKSVVIGTFNGTLTVDEEPVAARDVPVRTLEKRLTAMKVSHLALTRGLTGQELKKLLAALCAPGDVEMKEALGSGLAHIEMADVKYVALRDGGQIPGRGGDEAKSGSGTAKEIPSVQVSHIMAFLKGQAGVTESSGDLKKMLSDPEKLGQMILESAAIRQSAAAVQDGESMADVIIGCLRRTYSGLRKESEFQSAQGRINLTKAMMLLEKNVLDKIHTALGTQHPGIDRRILNAIREMEEEQQFETLTAHYLDQRSKLEKAEKKIVARIKQQGGEKAREELAALNIPPGEWQRLMIKAGEAPPVGGFDMGALAVVLEKLEGLMQAGRGGPEQTRTVKSTRSGLNSYTDRIEMRIRELEGQVELGMRQPFTIEDHAGKLSREELMLEISNLTLALLQPLTVVNASVEAALLHAENDFQRDLLDLAFESGRRTKALTERLMKLVGYPVLTEK
jgi:hypothetical protein